MQSYKNIASRRERKLNESEVKTIVDNNDQRVKTLLQGNRSTLNALAAKLEEEEVLSGEEVESIVKKS